MTSFDPTLFPGISPLIQVHSGFKDDQARSGPDVLAAVRKAMITYGVTDVTMVGHSLGSAIALIDSVYLPLHLPSTTTFRTVGYGQPRVGNQAFVDYIDANCDVTHINNKEDVVPTLPSQSLGFVHTSGEIHIEDDNSWKACPGQDDPNALCSAGDVTILNGNTADHTGPYDGVMMGC